MLSAKWWQPFCHKLNLIIYLIFFVKQCIQCFPWSLNFCEIWIENKKFSFKKMLWKMLSVRCFVPDLHVYPCCADFISQICKGWSSEIRWNFFLGDKGLFILLSQYHDCWWPGDTKSQDISSHVTDVYFMDFSTYRVNWNVLLTGL